MYVRELRFAYRKRRLSKASDLPPTPIGKPADCVPFLLRVLRNEPIEVVLALYLSTRHELLCFQEISRGSLDASVVKRRSRGYELPSTSTLQDTISQGIGPSP